MTRTIKAQRPETATEKRPVRPPLPAKLERHVRDRAGNRCQVPSCPLPENVEIHHIDGDRTHHSPGNLVVLCPSHHSMADRGQIPAWRLHWYNLRAPTARFLRRLLPFAQKRPANPAKKLLVRSSHRTWLTTGLLFLLALIAFVLLILVLRIRI